MSRAFVSEDAVARANELLPERPVSDGPNPVTPRGRQLIDARVAKLEAELETLVDGEDDRRAVLERDLRYWRARQASARVTELPEGKPDEVRFGTLVTLRGRDGRQRRYRLVGEDEADPADGLLSWASPLAAGLLGAMEGDVIDFDGNLPPVEVIRIEG